MSFKVQVGAPQISIHQGQTVLVSGPDGQIAWPSDEGLYFLDARVISSWSLFANGVPWRLLNGGAVTYFGARIFQTNRAFVTEDGPVEARALGITLSRHIDGGMHEDIDTSNNSGKAVRFNLEIAVRGDFADIFEVKSNRIVRRGRITTSWHEAHQQARLTYRRYAGFWVMRRSGGAVCRRFDDLDAVLESDTSDDFRQLICSIQAPPSF